MLATGQISHNLHATIGALRHEVERDGQTWIVKLMHTAGPGIVRMLWRMLANEQDVLDAYQECVCHLASIDKPSSVRKMQPYAYRVAANIAIEVIRRRHRRANHWPSVVATTVAVERSHRSVDTGCDESVGRLREALCKLPDHLREVIVLRDLAELPYRKVAGLLGVGVATARVYRRHAIIRLSKMLADESEQ